MALCNPALNFSPLVAVEGSEREQYHQDKCHLACVTIAPATGSPPALSYIRKFEYSRRVLHG